MKRCAEPQGDWTGDVLLPELLCKKIKKQKQSHFANYSQMALLFIENGGVRQTDSTADAFSANRKGIWVIERAL